MRLQTRATNNIECTSCPDDVIASEIRFVDGKRHYHVQCKPVKDSK